MRLSAHNPLLLIQVAASAVSQERKQCWEHIHRRDYFHPVSPVLAPCFSTLSCCVSFTQTPRQWVNNWPIGNAITGHMLYKSVMCLFEVTKPFQFFHLLIIFFNVTFLFPSELLRSKQEQMHLWIILTNPEENVQNSLPFTVFFFIYIKKKEIKRPWHWTLLAYRLRQQLWIDDWRPFQPFCHTFVFAEALLAEEINVFFQLPCPFDLLFFEKTNTTLIIKRRIRDSNN